jgi:hypothetical protein
MGDMGGEEGPPWGPPGAPPRAGGGRCACCEGMLGDTRAAGRPQRTDHMSGCSCFEGAVKVMRFAEELQRTAADLGDRAGTRTDRRRHQYLKKCAKELFHAACAPDPVQEVAELGNKYKVQFQKGGEHAADAGILSQACSALVNGETPVRLPSVQ